MKESYIGKRALFIGNGINRTEKNNGVSWGDLLRNISDTFDIPTDLTNDLKPFPLAFEEMLYKKDGRNNIQNKLKNLKIRLSEVLEDDANRLIDNEIHQGIMQCGIEEIITTNYDYSLQHQSSLTLLIRKQNTQLIIKNQNIVFIEATKSTAQLLDKFMEN